MENLRDTPGDTLRWLRHRRGLTLEQAAKLLHTSAPVLSRKERGAALIERDDVQMAISALRLDAWESYLLFTSAGYIPTLFPAGGSRVDIQRFADTLLPHITFPALIVDELLYTRAWNKGAQGLFQLPQDGLTVIHPIAQLFTEQVREQLGEDWQAYADHSLQSFQDRTLMVRQRPEYQHLLDSFVDTYGTLFHDRWTAAPTLNRTAMPGEPAQNTPTDGDRLPDDLTNSLFKYHTKFGKIEFVLTRSTWHFTQNYELNVYIPYGPHNREHYDQLRATLGPEQVFYGADPDDTG